MAPNEQRAGAVPILAPVSASGRRLGGGRPARSLNHLTARQVGRRALAARLAFTCQPQFIAASGLFASGRAGGLFWRPIGPAASWTK